MTAPHNDSTYKHDLFQELHDKGRLVAYQDWDSRPLGHGAGRVAVYEYKEVFYVTCDADVDGPYNSKKYAIECFGIVRINDATLAIWDCEKGFTYRRSAPQKR